MREAPTARMSPRYEVASDWDYPDVNGARLKSTESEGSSRPTGVARLMRRDGTLSDTCHAA